MLVSGLVVVVPVVPLVPVLAGVLGVGVVLTVTDPDPDPDPVLAVGSEDVGVIGGVPTAGVTEPGCVAGEVPVDGDAPPVDTLLPAAVGTAPPPPPPPQAVNTAHTHSTLVHSMLGAMCGWGILGWGMQDWLEGIGKVV